jgi:predicted ester cyclase
MSTKAVQSTQEEANRIWLKRYFEAVSGQAKSEALMRRFTTDESLIEHVLTFEAAFPKYSVIAEDVIAEGDNIVVRGRGQGRHEGEFAGIAATGREVDFPVIIIYQLAGELITHFWVQADMIGLLQQLDEAQPRSR